MASTFKIETWSYGGMNDETINDLTHDNQRLTSRDSTGVNFESQNVEAKALKENPHSVVKDNEDLPQIRFVNFDFFRQFVEIPRVGEGSSEFPNAPSVDPKHLTFELSEIDISKSFLVFVSHCWLAGWDGRDNNDNIMDGNASDEWRGFPHPDTKQNAKFKLLVEALNILRDNSAGGLPVYFWLDYCCVDNNSNPGGQVIMQMEKIIEVCDCVLTPVVDPDHKSWEYPADGWSNVFIEYKARNFNGGPYAYINRAWCRTEMLYAAKLPLPITTKKKTSSFRFGLKFALERNFRPHYLFGDKELALNLAPIQLPPLQNSYLDKFAPMACVENLTRVSDKDTIQSISEELACDSETVTVGYDGDLNDGDLPHGSGTYTYPSGNVFDGQWRRGKIRGRGEKIYLSGCKCEGEWALNRLHGDGTCSWSDGCVYEGGWEKGKKHGKGKLSLPNGSFFDGMWEDDKPNGFGECNDKDRYNYKGEWSNGKEHGKGKAIFTHEYYRRCLREGDLKNDNNHKKSDINNEVNNTTCVSAVGTSNQSTEEAQISNVINVYNSTYCLQTVHADMIASSATATDEYLLLSYKGDWSHGRKCGKGKAKYANGDRYDGEWLDDQPHGKGIYRRTSGDCFEGDFVKGRIHGRGRAVYANNDVYEGEWRDDMKHGEGVYTFANGGSYSGTWVEDKRHGHGTFTTSAKDVYDGEWVSNIFSGKGTYTTAAGDIYDGEWSNDGLHGNGSITYVNGDKYVGLWRNQRRHGHGKYTYAHSKSFSLTTNKHNATKCGIYTSLKCDVYDGEWENDKKHGFGRYDCCGGGFYAGYWVCGRRHGRGLALSSDGSYYDGDWKKGMKHGAGKIKYSCGDTYEGAWANDKRSGFGKAHYANGDTYEGYWLNDGMHGKGKVNSSNSRSYSGIWNENQLLQVAYEE